MQGKWSQRILGIAFIVLGILYTGRAFDLWNFSLFFRGFWTLFIIIPCISSIVKKGFTTISTIGLTLGGIWFLSAQNIIANGTASKLFLPIVLVAIGMSIVGKNLIQRQSSERITKSYAGGEPEYSAIFGGGTYKLYGEHFYGTSINAVFGGVDLNLREAIIDEDVVINASAIFGGIDILVPSNVKVKVSGIPIFGGIDNQVKNVDGENVPTIYINVTCMFGGIDIK